jgi:hypothetical protein
MHGRRTGKFRNRLGMTLVELMIGLVITILVVGASGALWYAVARAWGHSSGSQATALTGAHAVGRIERTMRESKYLIQFRPGSLGKEVSASSAAQLLFWQRDDWNSAADSTAQLGELAVLEHDPAEKRLYLYECLPQSQMTLDQQTRAGKVASWSELTSPSTPGIFKTYDFVRKYVFCEAVEGACVNVPVWGRSARPGLEFTLRLVRQGDRSIVYGLASLRAPASRPR